MRRYGNLYDSICQYGNLESAWKYVKLGKRYNTEVLKFAYSYYANLTRIQKSLESESYVVGEYHQFKVYDPKERLIQYLPLRDKIVQQALHQVINPIFDNSFIYDSYACRKYKGTHLAVERLQSFMNRSLRNDNSELYYLHCDISKYFSSIDRDVLFKLVSHRIKCPKTLNLIRVIIDSSPNPVGLPIGSLFSQLAANIYLNELDQFVKHQLREKYYLRYMDNFVILNSDKDRLKFIKQVINRFVIDELRLSLNSKNSFINKGILGIDFVGYKIFPTHIKIRKSSIVRMKKRLKVMEYKYNHYQMTLHDVNQCVNSWLGHCCHANTKSIVKEVLSNAAFTH